jgi:hypothetical protein
MATMDRRVMILLAIFVALLLVLVFWQPRCGAEGFMTGAPAHAKDLVIRDANDKIVFNNAKNAKTAKVVTIPVKCTMDGNTVFPYDDDVVSQKAIDEHEKKIKSLKLDLKEQEDQLAKKRSPAGKAAAAKAAKATAKTAKATAKAATQTAAKTANKALAKTTAKPGSKTAKAAAKTAAKAAKTAAKAATTAAKAKTAAKTAAKAKGKK